MTPPDELTDVDRAALHDLVHRYAADVDDRDLAAATRLFTYDAVLAMPDPPAHLGPVAVHRGRAGVTSALSALDAVPLTFHGIVGAVFDPGAEPDTAAGRVACVAHHVSPREHRAADLIWHLRYRDSYARVDGRWLFARRDVHIDLIDTKEVRRSRLDGIPNHSEHGCSP